MKQCKNAPLRALFSVEVIQLSSLFPMAIAVDCSSSWMTSLYPKSFRTMKQRIPSNFDQMQFHAIEQPSNNQHPHLSPNLPCLHPTLSTTAHRRKSAPRNSCCAEKTRTSGRVVFRRSQRSASQPLNCCSTAG